MSSGRSPLCLALFAVLTLGPARAQDAGPSTWTDPPARTAPEDASRGKSPEDASRDTPNTDARKATAPVAQEPRREETARTGEAPAPNRPAPEKVEPTQAERRQEQIRRAVARSTAEREAEAAARATRTSQRAALRRLPPRPVVERVERPQRLSERATPRPRERQAALYRSVRRPVYGYADPEPVDTFHGRYEAGPPAWNPRRWDEGAMPDDRARRIAQARAAGYLVMRSRSYAYPDGTVVRRLSPGGPMGYYDIED